jgi:hypothetical protein
MTENIAERSILLIGYGLMADGKRDALDWARRNGVDLYPLPVPAFVSRVPAADGRPATPQVAERLAELDALEAVFERLAERVAGGDRVLGLAIPPGFSANRSGRAWIDRVHAIARGIADLSLPVWTVTDAELGRSGLVATAVAG